MSSNRPIGGLASWLVLLALLFAPAVHAVPEIQTWKTPNGAEVLYVPSRALPMLDIRVVFDAAASRDGEQDGLAVLTNALLAEGAGGLDADAIAERFDGVGANFSNTALRDMAIVSLRTLTEQKLMDPALETFSLVLTRPDFPEQAFERERNRMLVALQQQLQEPDEIAEKAFYQALYRDHPYASPPLGTNESLKALTLADVKRFYRQYYVAHNAVVAIVGDVDRATAERIAERVTKGLEPGQAPPPLPKVAPLEEPARVAREHPSSQTHIHIGQTGVARGDPDYIPLYVANHALGGSGLVSLLSKAVREERGLAYSVYSYFSPMQAKGPFLMGSQTRNATAEEAREVMLATLKRYAEEGPTEEELEATKKNIIGGFVLQVDTNSDLVQYLAMIGFYDLPLDYLDTFVDRIRAVDRKTAHETFRRTVDPQRLVVVTVGGAVE